MEWVETFIGAVLIFSCGLGVYGFGLWAGNRIDKPMGFWANGEPLDPQKVTDIPAYNRAFGKLFRCYGYPCMLSGVVLAVSPLDSMVAYLSLAILVGWGVFGTLWLIHRYKQIEKHYIV